MICAALIGDLENGSLDEQQLEQELRTMIEREHISAFVFGYFGSFEQLALRVIQRLQKDYPLLDYTVLLTGQWRERPDVPELDYLHVFYLQGIWLLPNRLGLVWKYRVLASAADLVIAINSKEHDTVMNWISRAARKKRLYRFALA